MKHKKMKKKLKDLLDTNNASIYDENNICKTTMKKVWRSLNSDVQCTIPST